MTLSPPSWTRRDGFFPALGIMLLASGLALPSLLAAWRHDLYASGGPVAFGIWLVAVAMASRSHHANSLSRPMIWTVLGVLACAAGSMAALRVFHHLGFALAFIGLVGMGRAGSIAAITALAWLPASGWLMSRFHTGGLMGWERPAVACVGSALLLYIVYSRPRPKYRPT